MTGIGIKISNKWVKLTFTIDTIRHMNDIQLYRAELQWGSSGFGG